MGTNRRDFASVPFPIIGAGSVDSMSSTPWRSCSMCWSPLLPLLLRRSCASSDPAPAERSWTSSRRGDNLPHERSWATRYSQPSRKVASSTGTLRARRSSCFTTSVRTSTSSWRTAGRAKVLASAPSHRTTSCEHGGSAMSAYPKAASEGHGHGGRTCSAGRRCRAQRIRCRGSTRHGSSRASPSTRPPTRTRL